MAMPRLPNIRIQSDGAVDARVVFPKDLWALLHSVGSRYERMLGTRLPGGLTPGAFGARMLLERLADLVRTGNVRAIPGMEWQQGLQDILDTRTKAAAAAAPGDSFPADIDRSMLHLSNDRKSTYYGVIRYGTGFKARARHPSGMGEIELGAFKTAEEGAVARYSYYLAQESLCYGTAEEEVDYCRKHWPDTVGKDDAALWPEVVQTLQDTMRYEKVLARGRPYFVPGPRGPQLEAHRAGAPVVDTSELAEFRRSLSAEELGDDIDVASTIKPPTWAGLALAAPIPVEEEPKKLGRPRVHYEAGDGCACGRKWPCPRRQKSDD